MYFFHGVPSHSISEKVGLACQANSVAAVVAAVVALVGVAAVSGVVVVRPLRSMKNLLTIFDTRNLHSLLF